jgi:hypothetical protein
LSSCISNDTGILAVWGLHIVGVRGELVQSKVAWPARTYQLRMLWVSTLVLAERWQPLLSHLVACVSFGRLTAIWLLTFLTGSFLTISERPYLVPDLVGVGRRDLALTFAAHHPERGVGAEVRIWPRVGGTRFAMLGVFLLLHSLVLVLDCRGRHGVLVNSGCQQSWVREVGLTLRALALWHGRVLESRETSQSRNLSLRALHRVPHAQIVHIVHLLIWPGRGVPLLHVQKIKALGLLVVTLSLGNARRIQANLLYALYLLLPFVLPAPDVVI